MSSHSNKHQYWKAQIDHFKSSGLSIRKFCDKEGLKQHTFGYWLTRCGERRRKKTAFKSSFLPVVVSTAVNEARPASRGKPDPKWVAEFLRAFLGGGE